MSDPISEERLERNYRLFAERDKLRAENERLRAAIEELIFRHDIGGTNDQIQAAWNAAHELINRE